MKQRFSQGRDCSWLLLLEPGLGWRLGLQRERVHARINLRLQGSAAARQQQESRTCHASRPTAESRGMQCLLPCATCLLRLHGNGPCWHRHPPLSATCPPPGHSGAPAGPVLLPHQPPSPAPLHLQQLIHHAVPGHRVLALKSGAHYCHAAAAEGGYRGAEGAASSLAGGRGP